MTLESGPFSGKCYENQKGQLDDCVIFFLTYKISDSRQSVSNSFKRYFWTDVLAVWCDGTGETLEKSWLWFQTTPLCGIGKDIHVMCFLSVWMGVFFSVVLPLSVVELHWDCLWTMSTWPILHMLLAVMYLHCATFELLPLILQNRLGEKIFLFFFLLNTRPCFCGVLLFQIFCVKTYVCFYHIYIWKVAHQIPLSTSVMYRYSIVLQLHSFIISS